MDPAHGVHGDTPHHLFARAPYTNDTLSAAGGLLRHSGLCLAARPSQSGRQAARLHQQVRYYVAPGLCLAAKPRRSASSPPPRSPGASCIGWERGSNKALAGRASNSGTPQQQRQSDSFHEPQQSQKLNEKPVSNLCLQPIRNAPVVHISRRKNSIIAEHYTQNNNNFTASGTPRGAPFLQAQG
jgi:hypothetical protein